MSKDKVRDKVEAIREDGTKGTLVPFPYEEVVGLIEELENQAQVMRKHNELIGKLQELSKKHENVDRPVGYVIDDIMNEIDKLVEEYKL